MFILRIFLVLLWTLFSFSCGGLLWLAWLLGLRGIDLNRAIGRLFGRGALRICGFELEVSGMERLDGIPSIYVANHQSALDAVVFGSIFPGRTVVIGKKEVIWLPFFGWFFVAAGNILIKREKRAHAFAGLAKAAREVRERSVSVLIFPEGTRSRGKALLLPFKKGAFHLAIEAGVPIVPIVAESYAKRYVWRERKIVPGKIRIRVLDPIPTRGLSLQETSVLSESVRDRMLREVIELNH